MTWTYQSAQKRINSLFKNNFYMTDTDTLNNTVSEPYPKKPPECRNVCCLVTFLVIIFVTICLAIITLADGF